MGEPLGLTKPAGYCWPREPGGTERGQVSLGGSGEWAGRERGGKGRARWAGCPRNPNVVSHKQWGHRRTEGGVSGELSPGGGGGNSGSLEVGYGGGTQGGRYCKGPRRGEGVGPQEGMSGQDVLLGGGAPGMRCQSSWPSAPTHKLPPTLGGNAASTGAEESFLIAPVHCLQRFHGWNLI